MEPQTQALPANEHAFPMELVLVPAFVGGLLWLVAMLSPLVPQAL
jgi:hypothetical protein